MHNIKTITHKLKAFAQCNRGASAVEFALIATVLVIVLLNVYDIGLYMFNKMEITSSTRAGAQYALVDMNNATPALITAVVQNSTTLTGMDVTVDSTQCGCSDGSALFICTAGSCGAGTTGRLHYYTQITASYTHTWIFYPGTTVITATNTIRTQ